MRLSLLSVTMTAALLATPAIAQNTAPSMLGQSVPRPLPAPTPIEPQTPAAQTAAPPSIPAPTPIAPAAGPGSVTAEPLPPPGAPPPPQAMTPPPMQAPPIQAPPPMQTQPGQLAAPGAAPGMANPPSTAAAAPPAPLKPIPLTLPPLSASTKPTAKLPPGPAGSAKLPTPPLSPEASPGDFLRAARGALAAGRNGEARSALEMAQTRLLDGAVDAKLANAPNSSLAVKQISDAINALVSNDRMACLRYIQFASQTIGSPLE